MKRSLIQTIGLLVLLVALPASGIALTAQQVYQKVKGSIYTLYLFDFNSSKVKARGSAVAVSSNILATNCHVALSGDYLVVKLHKRKKYITAKLFYKNRKRDLCLLKIPGANFNPVNIRPSDDVKIGEVVYAVGNPRGTEKTLSKGIISNRHKVRGGIWLQTDAAVYFGSSGGGLFDEEGNLIGITSKMGGNFGFAIPTEWVVQGIKVVESKSDGINTNEAVKESAVHPEAVSGLSHLGTYGNDKIGLYRNNQECFLLIPGKNTNGNISSIALWNPKYGKTLVAFPSTVNPEKAMSIVYRAVSDKRGDKLKPYRSESVLYINKQPYPLYGSTLKGEKYPFLVARFSKSIRSVLLGIDKFKIIYKDVDPKIGNATIEYNLQGIAQGLSAFSLKCR